MRRRRRWAAAAGVGADDAAVVEASAQGAGARGDLLRGGGVEALRSAIAGPAPHAAVVAEGTVDGEAGDVIEADDGGGGAMGGAGGEVAARVDAAPADEGVVGDACTGAARNDEDLLDADHAEDAGGAQDVLGAAAPGDLSPAGDRCVVEQGARGGVGELEIDDGVDGGRDRGRGVGGLAVAELADRKSVV